MTTRQTPEQLAVNLAVRRGPGETCDVRCETPGCRWLLTSKNFDWIRPDAIKAHLIAHPTHEIHARYTGHEVFRLDRDPLRPRRQP